MPRIPERKFSKDVDKNNILNKKCTTHYQLDIRKSKKKASQTCVITHERLDLPLGTEECVPDRSTRLGVTTALGSQRVTATLALWTQHIRATHKSYLNWLMSIS